MKKTLLALSVATLLSACGGSDSDSSSNDNQAYSSPENISGIASSVSENEITVNGIALSTNRVKVEYGDQRLPLNSIQSGMRVDVETDRYSNAEEIELDPTVLGEITDIHNNIITVNGTNITTGNVTTYSTTADFQVGEWVFIDGYLNADNEWQVNNIFKVEPMHQAEMEGAISQLNSANRSFYIGNTQVNYANAKVDDDSPLMNGTWVEVEGNINGAIFNATEVDIEDDGQYAGAELEGTITWVNADQTRFELNGHTQITISTSTKWEDGNQTNLVEGQIVQVDLIQTEAGLQATEVEFEGTSSTHPIQPSNRFEVEGKASVTNSIITINHIEFTTDTNTYFDDRLTLATTNGSTVELEGVEIKDKTGDVTGYRIKEIELADQDNTIDLKGTVTTENTLFGYQLNDSSVALNVGSYTDIECNKDSDTAISNCHIDN